MTGTALLALGVIACVCVAVACLMVALKGERDPYASAEWDWEMDDD